MQLFCNLPLLKKYIIQKYTVGVISDQTVYYHTVCQTIWFIQGHRSTRVGGSKAIEAADTGVISLEYLDLYSW